MLLNVKIFSLHALNRFDAGDKHLLPTLIRNHLVCTRFVPVLLVQNNCVRLMMNGSSEHFSFDRNLSFGSKSFTIVLRLNPQVVWYTC